MSNPKQEWLDEQLRFMWGCAIDFARSDDFQGLGPEERDLAYISYLSNATAQAKAAINARFDEAVGEDEPRDMSLSAQGKGNINRRTRNTLRGQQRQAWYDLPTEAVEGRG